MNMKSNISVVIVILLLCLCFGAFGQQCRHARVLGAGVVGLTSAIQLQKLGFRVTIHAKASPLNQDDPYYASPHAGAWWSGNWTVYSYDTYSALMGQSVTEPKSTVIPRTATVLYTSAPDQLDHMTYADFWRNLTTEELASTWGDKFIFGYQMTCPMVTSYEYLDWLLNVFFFNGGNLVQEEISALSELTNLDDTALVVNSPGLGAINLTDVRDLTMYPERGQTVVVTLPGATTIYRARGAVDSTDPGNYGTYILPRANGEIIVGGTRQKDDWDTSARVTERTQILGRAAVLLPAIVNATILKDNVGLRPGRNAGIRLELDNSFKVPVVHNYGHSGYGFETSWGCAKRVEAIVRTVYPDLSSCSQVCSGGMTLVPAVTVLLMVLGLLLA